MTTMFKICWALWIAGMAIIVASWADVVTPTIGWIGFGLARGRHAEISRPAHGHPPQGRIRPPEEWVSGAVTK